MRHRNLVSFGRHPTALAAYRAAVGRLDRLQRSDKEGGPSPAKPDVLRRAVAKVNRLEPLAMIQAAIESTAAGRAGKTAVQVAREVGVVPGVVEKARAVRERPELWDRFLAGELNLGMAALLASKPPGWRP
jgi:hypothetical protein